MTFSNPSPRKVLPGNKLFLVPLSRVLRHLSKVVQEQQSPVAFQSVHDEQPASRETITVMVNCLLFERSIAAMIHSEMFNVLEVQKK